MGRYRTAIDETRIAAMLKAGYGQGNGVNYRPWLEVTQVPSRGLVCRVRGHTTGRIHHLLSQLETTYWYPLDWDEHVVDIREQFPLLPIADTQRIARTLGYRHPIHPKSHCPIVMTTDFLLTLHQNGVEYEVARAIKPSRELQSPRVCEKLAIERRYWQERNIDWGIVTEHELDPVFAHNLQLVASYWDITDRVALPPDHFQDIATYLTEAVTIKVVPLTICTAHADTLFVCASGTCLTVAYHLLAHRHWPIDWHHPLHPQRPLVLIRSYKQSRDNQGGHS
jgi:TnsA endonuclease N terminal